MRLLSDAAFWRGQRQMSAAASRHCPHVSVEVLRNLVLMAANASSLVNDIFKALF